MHSVTSRLGLERERQLRKLFPGPVHFCLLYKGSQHGFDTESLRQKADNQGRFVLIVYLDSGAVRGGYLSKHLPKRGVHCEDNEAFLFSVNERNAIRFPIKAHGKAFLYSYLTSYSFGKCLQLFVEKSRMYVTSQFDDIYGDVWTEEKAYCVEVEVHRVQDAEDLLFSPWREVSWTGAKREYLRKNLTLYKPSFEALSKVRVLLLGPVGAGKSSLINSIRSVLYSRVSLLPIIGSASEGFTKKLKCYDIRAEKGGQSTALTVCDVMGFGDSEGTGLTLHDTLAVIKGHVPEGHKFQHEASINFNTPGYRQSPAMEDTVHCAVFVLDACKVLSYSENLEKKLKKLHRMISDLEIPHVVLLTHVDQVCHAVQEDVQYVYNSRIVQERMQKAAELVGLPLSFVYPIKNYASEVSVNCNTDILLLSAVNQILQAIEDAFEDYPPAPREAKTKR